MRWSSALRWTVPALLALCLVPSTGYAGEVPVNMLGERGIAIQGYDPVAYFVDGEPRKGRPDLSVEYSGARWLFSNETNKRLFMEDPERYLPAYGGYCAYDVAQGNLSGVDPQAWTILYNRLYLNCPEPIHDLWLGSATTYIKQADENWRRLTGRPSVPPQPRPRKVPHVEQ